MSDQILNNLWLASFMDNVDLVIKKQPSNFVSYDQTKVLIISFPSPNENEKILALNIVKACNFQEENIMFTHEMDEFMILKKKYPNLQAVFLFGAPNDKNSWNLPSDEMRIQTINNISIITSMSLANLERDKNLKNILWNKILKPKFK